MPLSIFEVSFLIGLPLAILLGVVLRKYSARLQEKRRALDVAMKALEGKGRS